MCLIARYEQFQANINLEKLALSKEAGEHEIAIPELTLCHDFQ